MKTYNKEFTCTLSVQLLAEKLLQSFDLSIGNYVYDFIHDEAICIASGVENDLLDKYVDNEKERIIIECKAYAKRFEYITRIVESMIDSIESNGDACTHLFSTLNGWIKTDVPLSNNFKQYLTPVDEMEFKHLEDELEEVTDRLDFINHHKEFKNSTKEELEYLKNRKSDLDFMIEMTINKK